MQMMDFCAYCVDIGGPQSSTECGTKTGEGKYIYMEDIRSSIT